MEIDVKKVTARLEELYECGLKEDGTHTRMAYSKEDLLGREKFKAYFEQIGLHPRMDAAGNMIVRMEGNNPSLPAILIGSHLDTVPDGGKYDGVLGCMGGLGVCETLKESGYSLNHPVEVIVFTDEEGFRFGNGLLGSSAICGLDTEVSEKDEDLYGEPRSEVMKAYGIQISDISKAKKEPESVHCFLELHVEQGASLDKSGTSIGVVSSIAGVSRYEVTIQGEANHAGSTAMMDRKDALVAASRFIGKVPEIVKECGNTFTVATVGTIKVHPNSVNVIPGSCTFQLEIRDQDQEMIETVEKTLKNLLDSICEEGGYTCDFTPISYHAPAPMSDWVKGAVESAVNELGYDYAVIPSGAFHDALIMSSVFPTGMIFVPSVNGISHSREELTLEEDIKKGLDVLLKTVLEVDKI